MKKLVMLALFAAGACTDAEPRIEAVASPAQAQVSSADPALAVDPANGDVLMSWVAGDTASYHLYFARSSDGGHTWSAPVRITTAENDVKPHGQASPRIVAANGTIAVFWPNNIEVPGRRFPASHLRFSRSADGGRTWQETLTLNDDTASSLAGHTFHGAAFVPPSTLAVAWLDSRSEDASHRTATDSHAHEAHDGDATIYMALSKDLGATWAMQNSKLWGDACPCCRVSLAVRDDGRLLASWRSHLPGNVRDPVVAEVSDVPAPPVRVSADNWEFAGCPHTGPALHVDSDNVTRVAWYTGKPGRSGIYFSESTRDSLTFSEPVEIVGAQALPTGHPAIAVAGPNVLVASDVDAEGKRRLVVARVSGQRARSVTLADSDGADHPQMVALDDNRAVVAWTRKVGSRSELRVAIVQ